MDINNVLISGKVTKDPLVSRYESGEKASNFTIKIRGNKWKDDNGKWHGKDTYIDCRVQGKYMQNKIETIEKYFKKDRFVAIQGSLEVYKPKDASEDKSYGKVRVLVNDFYFLDEKPNDINSTSNCENEEITISKEDAVSLNEEYDAIV